MRLHLARAAALYLTLGSAAAGEASSEEALAELTAARDAFFEKAQRLPDEAAQRAFLEVGQSYFQFRKMGLDQRVPPQSTAYRADPFLMAEDYESPKAAFEAFLGGLFLLNDPTHFTDRVEVARPFELPFAHELAWEQVHLENGLAVPVASGFGARPPAVSVFNGGALLKVELETDDETLLPVRATGRITARLPGALTRLSFGASDLGGKRAAGPYDIELARMEGHVLELEITRRDGAAVDLDAGDLIVGAKDASGAFLGDRGSSIGKPAYLEAYFDGINSVLDAVLEGATPVAEAEAALEAALDSRREDFSKTFSATYYFRGRVDAADVLVMTEIEEVTRDLDLEMVNFNAPDGEDQPIRRFPSPALVRDPGLLSLLTPSGKSDLTAEEVEKAVGLAEPQVRAGEVQIAFSRYPEVESSIFMKANDRYASFWEGSVTFYDAGGEVIELPEEDGPYRLQASGIDLWPEEFPRPPARVAGTVTVSTAPGMTREQVRADALPEGLGIEDNMVIRSRDYLRDDVRVYALDGEGRPLKQFASIFYNRGSDPHEEVDYYHGSPQALLVLRRGELVEVPVAFDQRLDQLAEELPQ